MKFLGRSAIDVVIIMLSGMVTSVVVLATVGVVIGKLLHPTADYSGAEKVVGGIVTTVVSALIGFAGGRATGKMEAANGHG